MKITTFNIRRFFLIVLCFSILVFSSSYIMLITRPNGVRNVFVQLILAILGFLLFKNTDGRAKIGRQTVLIFAALMFVYMLDFARSSEVFSDVMVYFLVFIIALLVIFTMKIDEFAEIYTSIMYFLAITSLILFVLSFVAPQLISSIAPYIGQRSSWAMYDCIISVVAIGLPLRNFGLFWEPGAYQTFLIFAVYFELFINKSQIKRIVIFTLCILSTVSITGYFALFILLLGALYSKNSDNSFLTKRGKCVITLILVAGIASVFLLVPDESRSTIFDKIIAFLSPNSNNINTGASYSATVRYNGIIIPIRRFLQSPIIGIGTKEFKIMNIVECNELATCTPANWLAQYGIVYAGILFFGLAGNVRKMIIGRFSIFCVFLSLIMCITSESYISCPIVLVFALYNYVDPVKNKNDKETIINSN